MTPAANAAYRHLLDELDRTSSNLKPLDYRAVLDELEAEIKSRQDCLNDEESNEIEGNG